MKKKFDWMTIILIIILTIRIIGQVISGIYSLSNYLLLFSCVIFFVLYIICLFGVIIFKKWSYVMLIVVLIIDLIIALILGGATGVGAGLVDILGIILSSLKLRD